MHAMHLDDRDAGAVLSLVREVGDAQTLDDYADITMAGLLELVPGIDTSYNEMNIGAARVQYRATPTNNDLLEEFKPVFERYMFQNPLVSHFRDTGDTRTMMWSDFMDLDEIRATDLHREMFSMLGVDSQMAVTLPTPAGIVVGFAVNRDAAGFSERDRAVVNALRPHLGHAYRSIHVRNELTAAQETLRSRGWTGALADPSGIVETVTADAEELADISGVAMTPGEPLPEALRSSFTRHIASYRPSEIAAPSSPIRLTEDADGVAGWHVPGPTAPHVVMVRTHVDTGARRLRDAGLSPREVEVALELANGGTNAAIASRMNIAEGTVRKHLERVYRMLGVTDRASAIAAIRGW
jgi:DNA-binding CsgD family transcriptional regulator